MSKGFKTMLLIMLAVFVVTDFWGWFGLSMMKNLRWFVLPAMCLFALGAPPPRQKEFRSPMLIFLAMSFGVIAVTSSIWAQRHRLNTLTTATSVVIFTVFVCFALWPRLKKLGDYVSLLDVLAACGWLIVILSYGGYLWRPDRVVRDISFAWQGIFGNPNQLGVVMAVMVPVTVGRFHHRRKLRDLLLAALLAALVYKSQSRAGALGAAVGVVAFYAGYFGRKLWIVALAVVIGAMAYILYTDVAKAQRGKAEGLSLLQQAQDNFMRGEKDAGEYGSGRIPLWLSAYERWKLAPFLGHGFKTAGDVYYSGTDVPVRYHSSFVQIGSELGTVGLLFFFAPIVYSGIKSLKGTVKKGAGRMRDHAVVAALAAGWFGGVVDSCFESWLFAVGNVGTVLAWTCFFAGMKGLSQEDLYDELDGEGAGEPEEDDENVFYGFLPREKRQLTGGGRYVQ